MVRNRDGFQMAAGWMRAGLARPGRRLKAPEEGNRGQQRLRYEDLAGRAAAAVCRCRLFFISTGGMLAGMA